MHVTLKFIPLTGAGRPAATRVLTCGKGPTQIIITSRFVVIPGGPACPDQTLSDGQASFTVCKNGDLKLRDKCTRGRQSSDTFNHRRGVGNYAHLQCTLFQEYWNKQILILNRLVVQKRNLVCSDDFKQRHNYDDTIRVDL